MPKSLFSATLHRNGRTIPIKDLSKVPGFGPPSALANLVSRSIKNRMSELASAIDKKGNEVIDDAASAVKRRKLVDPEQEHLVDGYRNALKRSQLSIGSQGSVLLNIFDVQYMDETFPVSPRTAIKKGGWWRIHEFGSPASGAGASMKYGYISKKVISKIFGRRLAERFGGRHGEGVMINVNTRIGKILKLRPHKGVKPLRVAQKIQALGTNGIRSFRVNVGKDIEEAITR